MGGTYRSTGIPVLDFRHRPLPGSMSLATMRKREKKQGRRKRTVKKKETLVVGEPRDGAVNKQNLARQRLLDHGLLLI
ncbi:hypothetical protein B296_00035514 [Ensete ventricosum]|uniref:Uncharacterized protein n=1 Tax=Ensete ventricosum TaxID=4639 RepID=A0A427A5E4_ENSVE|nr:hypothetical protein B296_00035514 [Ensete ventricosum]